MGNIMEEAVMADLREAGIQIFEQQRAFTWDKYQITGHIDCKLQIDGIVYPTEIKSASDFAFKSINSVDDMLHHKWLYMRKYPAQLTLYMLMDNKDCGLFLFKNKSTGELKEIFLGLDYELGESLIQKAETINKHVADGTLPDCIEWDETVCGDCAFNHICMPERIGTEVEIVDDSELPALITRWNELKPLAKEYNDIDEQINAIVKGREKILAGDFFIQGKWIDKKNYKIPDDIKQQYVEYGQYWKKAVIPIQANNPPA